MIDPPSAPEESRPGRILVEVVVTEKQIFKENQLKPEFKQAKLSAVLIVSVNQARGGLTKPSSSFLSV